jgi:Glycine zipper 2TM domain
MRRSIFIVASAALLIPATPALADASAWAPASSYQKGGDDSRVFQFDDDDGDRGRYDRNGRYREPRRLSRNDRIWRGEDGRYRCRRGNGTTGLIIGGAVGALIGREVDGGRDRTVGTILGAAGGALLGREIDRGALRCR